MGGHGGGVKVCVTGWAALWWWWLEDLEKILGISGRMKKGGGRPAAAAARD